MTVTLQQRQQERSKRSSKDQKRRLSRLSLASLSCFSLYLAAGVPQQKPTMPGDVMQPMHVSAILSPIDNIASPRAIISEQSPVKKRRVGGSFTFECEQHHRYGSHSRSGSLALLRVLTAPPSPTADLCISPIASSPSPRKASQSTYKMRPHPSTSSRQRTRSPPRSVQAASVGTYPGTSITQSNTNPTVTQNNRNKSNSLSSLPSKNEPAPAAPVFAELTAAKALAGKGAASCLTFLPPSSEDHVTAWFDPEASASISAGNLKSKLMALSKGQSMVVVYPTRRGADTFTKQVLAPILDPVLRRAVNEHGLKTESAAKICKMDAVDSMLDQEDLEATMEGVVETINAGIEDTIRVRSSNTTTVSLPSDFWKYHWINQERSRVREIVKTGLGNGGGALVEMAGISVPKSAVRVTEEMLEGLKNHKFEEWEGRAESDAQAAIEVGVFVLARN